MSGFDERFEALRARFVVRCADDLAVLEEALNGGIDEPSLRATVHRLAGAAGTFGYREISRLAGAVDDRLVEGEPPSAAELTALVEAVRALVRA